MKKVFCAAVIVLGSLFLLTLGNGCSVTSTGGGNGVTDPSATPEANVASTEAFVGSLTCKNCHTTQYTQWQATNHSKSGSKATSETCGRCHATGRTKTGGWVSGTTEAKMAGVQCESCHGAGAKHVTAESSAKKTTINKIPNATTTCGNCHYMRKMKEGNIDLNDPDAVHAKVVSLLPGSGSGTRHPMHYGPNLALGKGVGGYQYSGSTYQSSSHFSLISNSCVTCHLNATTGSNAKDAAAGKHDQAPDLATCVKCHSGMTDFDYAGAQTETAALLATLKAELATYEAAVVKANRTSEAYTKALWNYTFIKNDGSTGVHNFKYAKKLLQDSINNFDPSNP